MTTKEAFLKLTEKRGWYKDLGIAKEAAWSLAKRVRDGEPVSTDKMEEVLVKAGAKVVQEKQWAFMHLEGDQS